MRYHQPGATDDLTAVEQDVDIDGAGAGTPEWVSPEPPLDCSGPMQQLIWSEVGIQTDNSVEECGRTRQADRSRLIPARPRDPTQGRERDHSLIEESCPVSQVGAEPQEHFTHYLRVDKPFRLSNAAEFCQNRPGPTARLA
jgi:hypothetical protein